MAIRECVSWALWFHGVSWQAKCGLGGKGVGERRVWPIHFGLDPGLVMFDFLLISSQLDFIHTSDDINHQTLRGRVALNPHLLHLQPRYAARYALFLKYSRVFVCVATTLP